MEPYLYNVSIHSRIEKNDHYSCIHNIHPLFPVSKSQVLGISFKNFNVNPEAFLANNCIRVSEGPDFLSLFPDQHQVIGTFGITDVENNVYVFEFPFGVFDKTKDTFILDLLDKSIFLKNRTQGVDVNHRLYSSYANNDLIYCGMPQSINDLVLEINEICSAFFKTCYDEENNSFTLEFFFSKGNIKFHSTNWSTFLGFSSSDLYVENLNYPYLMTSETPTFFNEVNLKGLNLKNIPAIVSRLTRELSGEYIGKEIKLIVQTAQQRFTITLPEYLSKENLQQILHANAFIVTYDNETISIRHNQSLEFKLRTSTPISAFDVNFTSYNEYHVFPCTLPKVKHKSNLQFSQDAQQRLQVQSLPSPYALTRTFLSGGYKYLYLPLDQQSSLPSRKLSTTGEYTVNVNICKLSSLPARFQQESIQIIDAVVELYEWQGVLKKAGSELQFTLIPPLPVTEDVNNVRFQFPDETLLEHVPVLHFRNDLLSSYILNVKQSLLYLPFQGTQLISRSSLKERIGGILYVKLIDFRMNTHWNLFSETFGFKSDIVARIQNDKTVSRNITFCFPANLHNIKFILLDEFGQVVQTTRPILTDLEMTIRS